MAVLNSFNHSLLGLMGGALAKHTESDILAYYGDIHPKHLSSFRSQIEELTKDKNQREGILSFFITTPGGVAEAVEKMVEIMRHFYDEVHFYIPEQAMSAGTILCMSGDRIYMDYSSSLGPIDPQVENRDGNLVPALGYLDEVEKLIAKSQNGTLTNAEFAILQNQDIATLQRYQQAKELSISLLTDWLVRYKFKNWDVHQSTGKKVTATQKKNRAKEIAESLSDNKTWHSHSRMIGMDTLVNKLRLKIEDYSVLPYKDSVRQYNEAISEYIGHYRIWPFIHTAKYVPPKAQ